MGFIGAAIVRRIPFYCIEAPRMASRPMSLRRIIVHSSFGAMMATVWADHALGR